MSHSFTIRVYYEDTDLAGIVYYANYLKFIERARSEWVRSLGIDQVALKSEQGLVFVVRRVVADYLAPAHFDDQLVVQTRAVTLGAARLDLVQEVWRGDVILFTAEVTLVAIGPDGRPVRLPKSLRAAIG
ncbi:MAG: tol-pal system-associated acyl-CoA thioesterase [Cypionkella sp.]